MKFRYEPRWKEMLDGFLGDHSFTVEIAMGKLHVFFPTENTWNESAPEWAKGIWENAKNDAQEWAHSNNIPFDISDHAWVDFK